MSRAPGHRPDFERLNEELTRAKILWAGGNKEASEMVLILLSSLAYAEAHERHPSDIFPEYVR